MGNFSLKWSEFELNVRDYFKNLREDENYCDVTLATDDGHQIQAHKIILSAGSGFFNRIFSQLKSKNLVIYLKGVEKQILEKIIDFLYNGETNVAQDNLNQFFDSALGLQVKGLQSKLDFIMVNNLEDEQFIQELDQTNEKTMDTIDSETSSDSLKGKDGIVYESKHDFVELSGTEETFDDLKSDSCRSRLDWTEFQKFDSIEAFKASDVFKELETEFSKSRSRENKYGDVSFYRCRFSRKRGFISCPYKLRVIYPSDEPGVVVEGIAGVDNHDHKEDLDYLDDKNGSITCHSYRWSDLMTSIVREGVKRNRRPDKIMKDLLHANNTAKDLSHADNMAPVIRPRIMPTKQQLNNKIAFTKTKLHAL